LESRVPEYQVGDCLANGAKGVSHCFTAYSSFAGRSLAMSVAMSEELEWDNGVVDVLECWIDVERGIKG
jgi:hypothetical protein